MKQALGPSSWDLESCILGAVWVKWGARVKAAIRMLTSGEVNSLNCQVGFIRKSVLVTGNKKAMQLDRHSVLDIAHSNTQVFRKQTEFQPDTWRRQAWVVELWRRKQSTWRQLSSCLCVLRNEKHPFHITSVVSSLAQSFLETFILFYFVFVSYFFPFC